MGCEVLATLDALMIDPGDCPFASDIAHAIEWQNVRYEKDRGPYSAS